MKPRVYWVNNGCTGTAAGWQLRLQDGGHLGTVFVDGAWYCNTNAQACDRPGSQPLAAQALLRAAGVEP